MKWRSAAWVAVGLVVTIGLLAGLVYVTNTYLEKPTAKTASVTCTRTYAIHLVAITDSLMSPRDTAAKLCDKLIITNNDPRIRLMAFGPHEHHTPYDGITERGLNQGQSLDITLNQLGTYTFHDHLEDEVRGSFTVTAR